MKEREIQKKYKEIKQRCQRIMKKQIELLVEVYFIWARVCLKNSFDKFIYSYQ